MGQYGFEIAKEKSFLSVKPIALGFSKAVKTIDG